MEQLILSSGTGPSNGDITLPMTLMHSGMTIRMLNIVSRDADGDPLQNGAYCVWFGVPPNGSGKPILLKDPGPSDRDCSYKITDNDVGLLIRNVMIVFTNVKATSLNGYTANPVASIPVDTISSRSVRIPNRITRIEANGYAFTPDAGFPTTGFKDASFRIVLSVANTLYDWSSDVSWVTVSQEGVVKLGWGNSSNGMVTITATPKKGSPGEEFGQLTYRFVLKSWFHSQSGQAMNWAKADDFCKRSGFTLPTLEQIKGTPGTGNGNRGVIGGLWSEWGAVNGVNSNFRTNNWTSTPGNGGHYLFYLHTGKTNMLADTSNNFPMCQETMY
ncbi:hypothetical protein LRN22_004167 [Salmonella enterica]|nr:hypothetical protein [Salmonella enterica]